MSDFPHEENHNDIDKAMEALSRTVTTSSQIQTHQTVTSTSSRVETSTKSVTNSTNSSLTHLKNGIHDLRTSIEDMKNNLKSPFDPTTIAAAAAGTDDETVRPEECVSPIPTVTFPDSPPPMTISGPMPPLTPQPGIGINVNTSDGTLKFEEKMTASASRTKVVTDKFSAEKNTSNVAEERRLQAGDVNLEQTRVANARHNKVEVDGAVASQNIRTCKENRTIKTGEVCQEATAAFSHGNITVKTDKFEMMKNHKSQHTSQTVTSKSTFNHEKHTSSQSNITIKGGATSQFKIDTREMSQMVNGAPNDDDLAKLSFDDLNQQLCNQQEVKKLSSKYARYLNAYVKSLQSNTIDQQTTSTYLNKLNEMINKAWAVPTYGHELGHSLCNELRTCGGLDLLMSNCTSSNHELQMSSARILEQCLTTENRAHVVQYGLDKVVKVACYCTKAQNHKNPSYVNNDYSRIGTGILEHLFKHSEETCSDVIQLGGLDAVLFECRKNDVETLRHCASALANLSLYGGAENQVAMIKRKVPMWLFPLAFHNDDNIKYYACLAITVLVANSEIEAAVLNSETLDLVEPFVTTHNPSEFAKSNLAHAHGQSKNWLERLVPVLSSNREEARNLAAFHFCMEAGIKKHQGNTEIFREINAIEPLKKVASCPNAVASKYAAQALRLMGEDVPHKLSQQVPLWSAEDVHEWVKQIGFGEYSKNFYGSRVDGDLLLQLSEEDLKEDIGVQNGISRKRFMRELVNLKRMADYSSKDRAGIYNFLQNIGPEYTVYTYAMLNAGVDTFSLKNLNEEHLYSECGIRNSIHRTRILDFLKASAQKNNSPPEKDVDKSLDVFVSYRRSNGSQLASLLKVHLQLRGFTVFIDVERLEAGKFDNSLLQSIRQAKHFILVLTSDALDRCKGDQDCKDWVHREIVEALKSQCNIIPILDGFEWPNAECLPEDMRQVCHFNGIRWIHDYQDACVDKLERFMRGEYVRTDRNHPNKGDLTPSTPGSAVLSRGPPSYQRMHSNDSRGSDN